MSAGPGSVVGSAYPTALERHVDLHCHLQRKG